MNYERFVAALPDYSSHFPDDVTVEEIQDILESINPQFKEVICYRYGLDGTESRTATQFSYKYNTTPTKAGRLLHNAMRAVLFIVLYKRAPKNSSGIPIEVRYWAIDNRTKDALHNSDIKTVDQLLQKTVKDLFKGGKFSWEHIRDLASYLDKFGLSISGYRTRPRNTTPIERCCTCGQRLPPHLRK